MADIITDRRTFLCGLIASGAVGAVPLMTACTEDGGTGTADRSTLSSASSEQTEQRPETAAEEGEFSLIPRWELRLSDVTLNKNQLIPNLNPSIPTWTGDGENPATNEQQAYTNRPQNLRVENGELIIAAMKEDRPYRYADDTTDYRYTSARVETFDSNNGSELPDGLAFEYGMIEVEAKIPEGGGTWPAPLWLYSVNMPATNERVQHAEAAGADQATIDALWGTGLDGEFDFEMYGRSPGMVEMTAHTLSAPDNGYEKTIALPPSADGFRRYAIEVTPDKVSWLIDGVLVHTFAKPSANPSVEDWPVGRGNKFGVISNLALGGEAGGPIDDSTGPWEMRIKSMKFFDYTGEGS